METTPLTYIHGVPVYRRVVRRLPANGRLAPRAKALRKAGILSEILFWKQVHKGRFHGIDFDRQRVIGNYIVDFYVKSLGLVIEIDGSSHDGKEDYDARRQRFLESWSLLIYRIPDVRVKRDLVNVMTELENYMIEMFGNPCGEEQRF
ncbi:endonuclease domain-containing protein [Tannerella forsythia]|uniref:DUF559 domain-containing protein n=2 Tax=Tannerella forsythia TaxID=28112 RepID=A0A3P1XM47_TANFO|nr:endonuclease domain-containing protein [Tannerella forsythia]RRD59545.1 DUF559 domain-containing protein [Tannerella forsythia]